MRAASRFLAIPMIVSVIVVLATTFVTPRASLGGALGDEDDCLRCHEALKAKLGQDAVHAPAGEGLCTACHSPHAARYPKMLQQRERALCNTCHEETMLTFLTGSVHTPVRRGECSGCHDPHAAPNGGLLKFSGNDLCLNCHEKEKAKAQLANVHSPFVDGECSFCHQPHNSPNRYQLNEAGSAVCTQCHEMDDESLTTAHRRISLQGRDCSRCHQPHASAGKGLFRDVTHAPFTDGDCDACHVLSEQGGLAFVATGGRLCLQCHDGYPREGDPNVHKPVMEGNCSACHRSHASDIPKLLPQDGRALCLSCHPKIEERFTSSRSAHPKSVEEGSCAICHAPHSSKFDHLMKSDAIRTCLSCHQQQQHGHPMGEGRTDPRTGKGITCMSCHDPHGTEFPMFLVGDQTRGLCVDCHSTDHQAEERGKKRR